jgi:hypothetical protein
MLRAIQRARAAISLLDPDQVRKQAEAAINIGLVSSTSAGYADMEDFLIPTDIPHQRRMELMRRIQRTGDPAEGDQYDAVLYEQGLPCPANAFTFYRDHPEQTVDDILAARDDFGLALAHHFPAFRRPVVDRIVHAIARENAMFAAASALPNVLPLLLGMPWSVGEFASDTAFITMNQVRMAFLVSAACNRNVGYDTQIVEVLSIVGSAFGWRALARELVSKIPLGAGILPKGAVAYAGTYAVGKGLEQLYCTGRRHTRSERNEVWDAAYARGTREMESLSKTI